MSIVREAARIDLSFAVSGHCSVPDCCSDRITRILLESISRALSSDNTSFIPGFEALLLLFCPNRPVPPPNRFPVVPWFAFCGWPKTAHRPEYVKSQKNIASLTVGRSLLLTGLLLLLTLLVVLSKEPSTSRSGVRVAEQPSRRLRPLLVLILVLSKQATSASERRRRPCLTKRFLRVAIVLSFECVSALPYKKS